MCLIEKHQNVIIVKIRDTPNNMYINFLNLSSCRFVWFIKIPITAPQAIAKNTNDISLIFIILTREQYYRNINIIFLNLLLSFNYFMVIAYD